MNSSGAISARLAYGNGFGVGQSFLPYLPFGLSSPIVLGSSSIGIPYLFKDSITSVNKNTSANASLIASGIFSQTGVRLAKYTFGTSSIPALEAGNNLNVSGGYLWSYDGTQQSEYGFHLYPDLVQAVGSGSSGAMSAQSYFYQFTYEWTDNQGNTFASSPSVPINVILGSGTASVNLLINPVNLTNKKSPISVGVYRWSAAQQTYYKVTALANAPNSISNLPLNGSLITYTDSLSDAQIIGNQLLYTTGGVVENSSPPAVNALTIFDSRGWYISAEDPNLLGYSKQLIEAVPLDFSDLFTVFVPPTSSTVGSTGPMKCLAPMDDKLIIFKANSIYYMNGTGPDNTGANSQYSPPTFITSGVGCSNQSSIVLTPNGLMFQSNKGIWLLGRDLSVSYIGKEVQDFNTCTVLSAQTVPGTNEVRFTLGSSGQTLVYDYFAGQWDQTVGAISISSVIYNGLQANLQTSGSVTQETPGVYLDGGVPVTMGFTTGWIGFGGLQGYVRAYKMFLLGKFVSPHTYTVGIAYDYNPTIVQTATINPTNVVGSGSIVEQWQINFQQQQTQAFQLTFTEISSSTAGAGLYLSGIKIVYGTKLDYPRNIGVTNITS